MTDRTRPVEVLDRQSGVFGAEIGAGRVAEVSPEAACPRGRECDSSAPHFVTQGSALQADLCCHPAVSAGARSHFPDGDWQVGTGREALRPLSGVQANCTTRAHVPMSTRLLALRSLRPHGATRVHLSGLGESADTYGSGSARVVS